MHPPLEHPDDLGGGAGAVLLLLIAIAAWVQLRRLRGPRRWMTVQPGRLVRGRDSTPHTVHRVRLTGAVGGSLRLHLETENGTVHLYRRRPAAHGAWSSDRVIALAHALADRLQRPLIKSPPIVRWLHSPVGHSAARSSAPGTLAHVRAPHERMPLSVLGQDFWSAL